MDIRDGTTTSQEEKERYAKTAARMREYTLSQMEREEIAIVEEAQKMREELKAERLKQQGKPEK